MSQGQVPLAVIAVVVLSAAGVGATICTDGRQGHEAPLVAAAALETAIADIEAGRRTTPLISGPTSAGDFIVTFLARSSGREVPRIVSDATGWGEDATTNTFDFDVGRMTRVGKTNWYSLVARIAPRARIEYLVVQGRFDYRLDPYNPRRQERRAGGAASEFVTPGYAPPESTDASGVPSGTATETTLESRVLRGWRRAIVYTPPGYRRDCDYPLAVFQYGVSLVLGGKAPAPPSPTDDLPPIEPKVPPRLLDDLIARREIEPIVAVFLESRRFGDSRDYPADAMRTFLASEVPAWAASRYGAGRSAEKRAILGTSYSARDALDAAVAPSGAYGRVGLLIPGRRMGREQDILGMVAQARLRMRVAILAGLYDHANLPTAHALRRTLNDSGHVVEYIEVPEGHTMTTWRDHLREVFVALFKPRDAPRTAACRRARLAGAVGGPTSSSRRGPRP